MKLLTALQIREADQYTIKNEPISSIDLMERAARQCTNWILQHFSKDYQFNIFTGPGNNGGDGLAIARQLAIEGYKIFTYQVKISDKLSEDSQINLSRLREQNRVEIYTISNDKELPELSGSVIIDAIFGSGLSRPVEGLAKKVINHINASNNEVIAIDIPSGLFSESNCNNNYDVIIKANYTLTFQVPKLSFLLAGNNQFVGKCTVLDIGLSQEIIESFSSNFFLITKKMAYAILKPRSTFSHKGTFGHALLIAGSFGRMGATVLGARACLRTGCGLLTVHVPYNGVNIIQTAVPEAMVNPDECDNIFTTIPDTDSFSALGIGPGIGLYPETKKTFEELVTSVNIPLVIDADGLNIIGQNKKILKKLPENCILTPHPKEFERIGGKLPGDFDNFDYLSAFAKENKCFVVFKEAFTKIACPNGKIYINSSGNPGMATAGSGDTLTGMILSLLAQGYTSEQACLLGVYLHGLAGDLYAHEYSEESLIADDIINNIGNAFKKIRSND